MEKLAKNNQYNHYCEKCKAWKLHARGPKFYRCLACNTKTARGLTKRAVDGGEVLPPHNHIYVDGYCACGHAVERHRH